MRISRKLGLILFFLLFLLAVRYVNQIGPERIPGDRFRAARVIDGDTIELNGGDRLRLLGLDCPEKGQPFADSAEAFVRNLTAGRNLRVDYSVRKRDGYGRLLGYVYADSVWVNHEILLQGLAHLYLFDDTRGDQALTDQLLKAQVEAMDSRRGVWSLRHRDEGLYFAEKGGYRFHRPSCRSLKRTSAEQLVKFSSREEPFRLGYSPCRNCQP